MKRIVAANRIVVDDTEEIELGVVEIDTDSVVKVYRLDGEQPFTEWLGGTISVRKSADGMSRAFWQGKLLTSE